MATVPAASTPFAFPSTYNFPPFFTPQPNTNTRQAQLEKWSSLIQAWCKHHRQYKLSLTEAIDTPLFHNVTLRKRLDLREARAVIDWMAKSEAEGGGGRRAEWIDATSAGGNQIAWIWWRRPEEWADVVGDWVDATGQRGVVLTVYELLEGDATVSQGVYDDIKLICGISNKEPMQNSTVWTPKLCGRPSTSLLSAARHKSLAKKAKKVSSSSEQSILEKKTLH